MTLDERIYVVKLTRSLFPDEIERYPHQKCESDCASCGEQIAEWNALIWRVYNSLIEVNLV